MNFKNGFGRWSRLSNAGPSQRTCSRLTRDVVRLDTLAIVRVLFWISGVAHQQLACMGTNGTLPGGFQPACYDLTSM